MNYFTKYIPVDGDVKYLDHYTVKYSDDVYQHTDTSGQVDYSDCKKVKLFLCSADKGLDWEEYCDKSNEMGELPFKVIGEISPEATWIKEGDKIDSTDIGTIARILL